MSIAVVATLASGLLGAVGGVPAVHAAGLDLPVTVCAEYGMSGDAGTLADALARAAGADGSTIHFECDGTITVPPRTMPISNTLTITARGREVTLDGASVARLFWVEEAANLTLDALTLRRGLAYTPMPGGALLNQGTASVVDSAILDNGGPFGAGIANMGQLTVVDSIISGNQSQSGSAMINFDRGDATITNSRITDNVALLSAVTNDGTLLLDRSTISGNVGTGLNNSGTATLTLSSVADNSASQGVAGGVHNVGTLTIRDSSITGNRTGDGDGGGIGQLGNGNLQITGSTISGNSAQDEGGGLHVGQGSAAIVNSTITRNSAQHGGGLYVNGSNVTLTNTTVSDNSGGGVYRLASTVTAFNTIIAGNSPSNCPVLAYRTLEGENNLTDRMDNSCGLSTANHDVLAASPGLGSLADNGGPTQTMALLSGSPAIGAANVAVAMSSPVNAVDQRGVARGIGGVADIGAFEAPHVPEVTLLPGRVDFGEQSVGTASAPRVITLTNTGSVELDISDIALGGADAADFLQSHDCPPAGALPAHASCRIEITFTPTEVGARSATLAVSDDAEGSPHEVGLDGVGLSGDREAPTTTPSVAPLPNPAGWHNDDVTVALPAVDNPGGSGVLATYYRVDGGLPQVYLSPIAITDDGVHTVTYRSIDNAGNQEAFKTLTVKLDKTPPTFVLTTPSDGATYLFGHHETALYTASDDGSGVMTVVGTVPSGGPLEETVGWHEFTVIATDHADNTARVEVRYQVVYESSGALPPLGAHGSVFALGRVLPVKLALTGASASVTDAVISVDIVKVSDAVAGPVIGPTPAGAANVGNVMRYDPTSGQYVYNLSTKGPGFSVGTFRVRFYVGGDSTTGVLLGQTEFSLR